MDITKYILHIGKNMVSKQQYILHILGAQYAWTKPL